MSSFHPILELTARLLRSRSRQSIWSDSAAPRILVIRRNRLGDMLCTVPLFHALRARFPSAHLTVACDPPGAPAARACAAVNEVVVLGATWSPRALPWGDASQIQSFDYVIAAKVGFDRRLATLARLTNGAMRIGFESTGDNASAYYTHTLPLPNQSPPEHQVDAQLRLLQPLGIDPAPFAARLELDVPPAAREFAATLLARAPFTGRSFVLINLSSTSPLKFSEESFAALVGRILKTTDLAVGFVAAPADQSRAAALAARVGSERVTAVATPGPLELAALLSSCRVFVTPEGGAAHLAAAVGAPALVLWSEGPFEKWHSRAPNHRFVRAQGGETAIPVERVWRELEPCVNSAKI